MTYQIGPRGKGLVSGSSGASALTGDADAEFTRQFAVGDTIYILDADLDYVETDTVAGITSDTALTISGTWGSSFTDYSYCGLRTLDAMLSKRASVRSVPVPGGEAYIRGDGVRVYRGYPRARWDVGLVTVAQWEAFREMLIDELYSGEVYVETRDDIDVFEVWRAIARFSDPGGLDRWAGRYRSFSIELILLSTLEAA